MGVPKFFRYISERYPCISQEVTENQIPQYDNLYLDMNGIIHNCTHTDDDELSLYKPEAEAFRDITNYIEFLFATIQPKKVFFMAIDGVAPRAKMNQQRSRRFMSARDAEIAKARASMEGISAPPGERFDSNCITPGTPFMDRLHKHLDAWIREKVNADPLWRQNGKLRIYFSGHNCPGEGEHKIMDFIRAERIKPDYDPNTRHCMYGLDADLMMLGLSSHEPHFSLLREEVKFRHVRRPQKNTRKQEPQKKSAINTKFFLLHLQLFREYLGWEFKQLKTLADFCLDSIIDDWVLMGFLIGNDFLPHLPHVNIHEEALPLLYKAYIRVRPSLGGYMNEKGVLNLDRFKKFLLEFSETDKRVFLEKKADEEFMAAKRQGAPKKRNQKQKLQAFDFGELKDQSEGALPVDDDSPYNSDAAFNSDEEEEEDNSDSPCQSRNVGPSCGILSAEAALADLDIAELDDDEHIAGLMAMAATDDDDFKNDPDNCWSVQVNNSFKRNKKIYYREKLKFGNITTDELAAQASGYVRAIQWNLHYYYHGCVSWNWFFPYHYAPFLSDIATFATVDLEFELSEPFRPFEQLLAVLPAASCKCLPKCLQSLMTDETSPIIDFYPADFDVDLNGKKNDWEAVVLIPFINQERLLRAIRQREGRFSPDEVARNTPGPHILYTADMKQSKDFAVRQTVDKDEFRIAKEKVFCGLLPGVKLDNHFPGFPTMSHLEHDGYIARAGVKVFHQVSYKDSIMLKPATRKEFENLSDEEIAREILGKEIYIEWPLLVLAKAVNILTMTHTYSLEKDGTTIRSSAHSATEAELFRNSGLRIVSRLRERYAIEIQPCTHLVQCQKFLGCSIYVENNDIKRRKQWSSAEKGLYEVPLQIIVNSVHPEDTHFNRILTMSEAFPTSSAAFIAKPQVKQYGWKFIIDGLVQKEGRFYAAAHTFGYPQFDFAKLSEVKKRNSRMRWMDPRTLAREVKLPIPLINRLTGTLMLILDPKSTHSDRAFAKRMQIGLNLKWSKQSKEIPDYTRRDEQRWQYSQNVTNLLLDYQKNFFEIVLYLENRCTSYEEELFAEEIWPDEQQRARRLADLANFLADLPTASIPNVDCDTQYLEGPTVLAIQQISASIDWSTQKKETADLPVEYLFRKALVDSHVLPDPEADFVCFDRIVFISEDGSVPVGLQGTIVGLPNKKLEVIFDKEFPGGQRIRGSGPRGAIVSPVDVFNITFTKSRKIAEAKARQQAAKRNITPLNIVQQLSKSPLIVNTAGEYSRWVPPPKASTSKTPSSSGNNMIRKLMLGTQQSPHKKKLVINLRDEVVEPQSSSKPREEAARPSKDEVVAARASVEGPVSAPPAQEQPACIAAVQRLFESSAKTDPAPVVPAPSAPPAVPASATTKPKPALPPTQDSSNESSFALLQKIIASSNATSTQQPTEMPKASSQTEHPLLQKIFAAVGKHNEHRSEPPPPVPPADDSSSSDQVTDDDVALTAEEAARKAREILALEARMDQIAKRANYAPAKYQADRRPAAWRGSKAGPSHQRGSGGASQRAGFNFRHPRAQNFTGERTHFASPPVLARDTDLKPSSVSRRGNIKLLQRNTAVTAASSLQNFRAATTTTTTSSSSITASPSTSQSTSSAQPATSSPRSSSPVAQSQELPLPARRGGRILTRRIAARFSNLPG